MEKVKTILDNKATWALFGMFAGSLFGDQGAAIVNALGGLVMTAI